MAEVTDAVREIRAENYGIKRRARFRCQEPDCDTQDLGGIDGKRLLVVETTVGPSVRCEEHAGAYEIRPHQWDQAERAEEELRKKKK